MNAVSVKTLSFSPIQTSFTERVKQSEAYSDQRQGPGDYLPSTEPCIPPACHEPPEMCKTNRPYGH